MKTKINSKLLVFVAIVGIIVTISTMVSAYSVGMSLSSKSKLKAGDTVTVTVNLGNVDAGNGIDTITGELSYDTNVFETLSTSNFIASNDWTPTYAASTNMITVLKNTKVKSSETVLTISLKVKDNTMAPVFTENDIVIIKKQNDCDNNEFAIVIINEGEGTLKKIKKIDNGIILQPLNPAYRSCNVH